METLSDTNLQLLLPDRPGLCVSLFMPVWPSTLEASQNLIHYTHLIEAAETGLIGAGLRPVEARAFLQRAQDWVLTAPLWRIPGQGLALFLAPDEFYQYQLPLPPEALVVVGHRFHLKPLLPLLSDPGPFYLLAFSRNRVQFFKGTRAGLTDLRPKNVPKNLAETLRYDAFEKQHQFHTASPGGRGRAPAIFHGHGATATEVDRELERYCRQIDQGLYELLKHEKAPLLVACVDELFPIYRTVNRYPYLCPHCLPGNPDRQSLEALHRQAWQHLRDDFQAKLATATHRYQALRTEWRASDQLETILSAAFRGQIEELFVAVDRQRWGYFDPATAEVVSGTTGEPGVDELLDLAAVQTLRHGGIVHAVPAADGPDGGDIAAIFRYAIG